MSVNRNEKMTEAIQQVELIITQGKLDLFVLQTVSILKKISWETGDIEKMAQYYEKAGQWREADILWQMSAILQPENNRYLALVISQLLMEERLQKAVDFLNRSYEHDSEHILTRFYRACLAAFKYDTNLTEKNLGLLTLKEMTIICQILKNDRRTLLRFLPENAYQTVLQTVFEGGICHKAPSLGKHEKILMEDEFLIVGNATNTTPNLTLRHSDKHYYHMLLEKVAGVLTNLNSRMEQKEWKKADEVLLTLKGYPFENSTFLLTRIKVALAINDHEKLTSYIKQLDARAGDCSYLLHKAGTIYWIMGEKEMALYRFRRALQKEPENFEYAYDLSSLLIIMNRVDRGREIRNTLRYKNPVKYGKLTKRKADFPKNGL